MKPPYRTKPFEPTRLDGTTSLRLMANRLGSISLPKYYKDTVDTANLMAEHLNARGGFPQQERMIRDKRKSLDRATLYSYQACFIKKV